jgi:hypothetical protein
MSCVAREDCFKFVNIIGNGTVAAIAFSPNPLDFGSVKTSETATAQISGSIGGGTPVTIHSASISGTDAALFTIDDSQLPITLDTTSIESQTTSFDLTFTPNAAGSFSATVAFDTSAGPFDVNLIGNSRPCISVEPAFKAFDASGEQEFIISNSTVDEGCGSADLTLGEVKFDPTLSDPLDPTDPSGAKDPLSAANGAYKLALQFGVGTVVPPAGTASFTVTFTDNPAIANEITVVYIAHNDPFNPNPLMVTIVSTDSSSNAPPVASIKSLSGDNIRVNAPPAQIMLTGADSWDDNNAFSAYKWVLISYPPAATGTFMDDAASTTTLTIDSTSGSPDVADIAGEYKVQLDVWDDLDQKSTVPAVYSFRVSRM